MTSQLTKAMAEYPDELRVCMEAAGYEEDMAGYWWRIEQTPAEKAMSRHYAPTDNDAMVACIEWLINGDWHLNMCQWTTTGLLIQALELVRQANESDKRFKEMIR